MENIRNAAYNGKYPFLPPKIPFPIASPSYADYVPNSLVRPKGFANPKDMNSHHQRTSSESVLLEEQPSWLDELLDEPDTPVRKGGHRRSSSDSFAYVDVSNVSMLEHGAQHEFKHKNMISTSSWGSQDFDRFRDVQHSFYPERSLNLKNLGHSARDNVVIQSPGSSSVSQEADGVSSTASQKKDLADSGLYVPKSNFELKDPSNVRASVTDSDTKRAKQQFAQRSRVRKLQYIAELETNVQALQTEGSEISAELEFVNQQNLILNMENKTLKQRVDSLAQEQLIKYMEHEMLEREVGRLRTLGQQHQLQQQQPPSSSHRRTNSRDLDSQHRRINSKDLDSQFSNLSLKQHHKGVGWGPLNS